MTESKMYITECYLDISGDIESLRLDDITDDGFDHLLHLAAI